jgi:hypothetical protein
MIVIAKSKNYSYFVEIKIFGQKKFKIIINFNYLYYYCYYCYFRKGHENLHQGLSRN